MSDGPTPPTDPRPLDGPDDFSQQAVLGGATVALTIAIPVVVVAQVVAAFTDLADVAAMVMFLVIITALVLGARAAALRRPRRAYLHGVMAALGAYLVIVVLAFARFVIAGSSIPVLPFVTNAFLVSAAGVLGGSLALATVRRRQQGTDRGDPTDAA